MRTISIARAVDDPVASQAPVLWAIEQLRAAVEAKGVESSVTQLGAGADAVRPGVLVAGRTSREGQRLLARAGVSVPDIPEAFSIAPWTSENGPLLVASGSGARGLIYAILELADRVAHAPDPFAALHLEAPLLQRPANQVRSVARLFTSEQYDKPWFHDRDFWRRYLSMVVAQRFNRVNLMVGLGYNFPWRVTDSYLLFAYPFLVRVPGYNVRVRELGEDERKRNLEMLRFISDEAAARGLDFQFGIWTHAYEWLDSPDAKYTILGLKPELHATYCRDALQALLEACPAISGITLRTHGESGVPERSWSFWETVLEGPVRAGRRVQIDLHAKGLDVESLRIALATGLPITVSPKFSAEHMGLPYHQAAIREYDRRSVWRDGEPVTRKDRYMLTSEGSRPFTRYGYGDFLREGRPYDVVFRIWPGTQRVLLWGDPAMASGLGRNSSIAGSQGLEWCEPLSLRGREGSAVPGSRDGYADGSLSCADDWRKYEYTYRLIGRLTYDPDASPETWRRFLRTQFGSAALDAEAALASASRILPLVTTAHHPSASNNYYWPEIYTDMPIVRVEGSHEPYYYDAPRPKRFGTVSALDPEIFSSVEGYVTELLNGGRAGRYSPMDVARWLAQLSADASRHLMSMRSTLGVAISHAARRLMVDVAIQGSLGRFFAGKFRAAAYYEIALRTGSQIAMSHALASYVDALAEWTKASASASGVYAQDLTFGPQPWLRGVWGDRLPAMRQDFERVAALAGKASTAVEPGDVRAVRAMSDAERIPPAVTVTHVPPASFRRGWPLPVVVQVDSRVGHEVDAVLLRYRHLNQAEEYAELPMVPADDGGFSAAIPDEYTDSPYPIAYFLRLHDRLGSSWMYPGIGEDLSAQPYFVICSS